VAEGPEFKLQYCQKKKKIFFFFFFAKKGDGVLPPKSEQSSAPRVLTEQAARVEAARDKREPSRPGLCASRTQGCEGHRRTQEDTYWLTHGVFT
jgi:hypothetical protein